MKAKSYVFYIFLVLLAWGPEFYFYILKQEDCFSSGSSQLFRVAELFGNLVKAFVLIKYINYAYVFKCKCMHNIFYA